MKKYIVPEIGITYFETEKIMTGNDLIKLSELNSIDLFDGSSDTKSTGGISFGTLKVN